MKIIDIYNKYKKEYKEYVIIIESGVFYYVLNDDCGVINKLLDYKIKYLCGNFSIGFPINSINKVTEKLNTKEINYLVLKKSSDGYIIDEKNKENNNNYGNYLIDLSRLNYLNDRINRIYNKLLDRINDSDIEEKLLQMEKLL